MLNTEYYDNTVNGEIIRGQKLQKQKLKQCLTSRDYVAIDIDFDGPSSSLVTRLQDINAKNLAKNGYTRRKKQNMPKTENRICKNASHRNKSQKQCPIHILQLSSPTKRQCLETWRKNQDILPDYMIDRLRQMIMDKKPIVQLNEAVNCFKKRKKIKSRLSTSYNAVLNPKQIKELKILSALLTSKIIKKLLRPININLNSELQCLSKVIYDEIGTMTQYSKINANHKFQSEIANKATIWIANVLEDSSFLQLLEDYEELKRKEEPIWNIIDDLIDTITVIDEPQIIVDSTIELLSSCDSKASIDGGYSKTTEKSENYEAERTNKFDFTNNTLKEVSRNKEQELKGTEIKEYDNLSQYVRDIIDEVIDAYKSRVQNNPLVLSIDKDDIIHEHSIENNTNFSIVQQYSISVINNNESEYFHKFVKDIIDDIIERHHRIKKEDTDKVDSHNEAREDVEKTKISIQNSETKSIQNLENKTGEINTYNINTIAAINKIKTENDNIVLANSEMMESPLDIDNERIELKDVVADSDKQEDNLDDSIKKVKFSDINIGSKRVKGINIDRNSSSSQEIVIMHEKSKLSIDKSVKPVLDIAPPNDHLLSDADESWPENLSFPVLKASISVSKSIQSLGKIIENEEKYTSPEEYGVEYSKDNLLQFQNRSTIIKENLKLSSNKFISSDTYPTVVEFQRFDKRVNDSKVDITIPGQYDDELKKNIPMYLKKESQTDIKNTVTDKIKETEPFNLEMNTSNSNTDILHTIVEIEATNEFKNSIFIEEILSINGKNRITDELINHMNSIARLTIKHLPLINIDNICNDKLTHEKCLQTDKNNEQTIYAISKATQRSEVTKRKYSNINPEGEYITELKLRQWCLGLKRVIENLEMWTDWIENTCTYILFLKHPANKGRKMMQNKYKMNELKTNIDLDAKLWLKLSKNNQLGLLKYRNYCNNLEFVPIATNQAMKLFMLKDISERFKIYCIASSKNILIHYNVALNHNIASRVLQRTTCMIKFIRV